MNRCSFVYTHPIFGDSWQCTKWEGHTKERGNKTHTALAPSGWDPRYAIRLTGHPNNRDRYVI